jgi:OmcA/MtrC family decaheme c-type cytochrome
MRLAATALALTMIAPSVSRGQEAALAWDQVRYFRYNILSTEYDASTRAVTVVFTVTNPAAGNTPYDILGATAAAAFKSPATLRVDVAWSAGNWGTTELVNTKDGPYSPIARTAPGGVVTGPAPASATAVNALSLAKRCSDAGSPCPLATATPDLAYWVKTTPLPAAASSFGRVALEGHPSVQTGVDPVTAAPIITSVPVKSVFQDFQIGSGTAARRKVVDFAKCAGCHDNRQHEDTLVPRLSLHGANRNEEPGVCVMCHNPNQTDAAYRTSGAEESVDFKRLVHGIHAGKMRRNPLIIIGRNGSVNDYSHVEFPSELKNCMRCHVEISGKGTYELPLSSKLGSTIASQSVWTPLEGQIDIDPNNDLRISPIAATCSGCHDSSDNKRHMIAMGASFGATQSVLAGKEQCVTCHGPGRSRDVRKEHGLGERR